MGYAYDYWSAMHYGPFAFSAKKREPTIKIKKIGRRVNARIGLRVLSKLDIAKVRAMYNCNPIPSFEARKGRPLILFYQSITEVLKEGTQRHSTSLNY